MTRWPGLQVYKGVWQGNTPVAVKFVTGHSPKEQQRFRNEVAILKSLRHVNIVQFLGASLTGGPDHAGHGVHAAGGTCGEPCRRTPPTTSPGTMCKSLLSPPCRLRNTTHKG